MKKLLLLICATPILASCGTELKCGMDTHWQKPAVTATPTPDYIDRTYPVYTPAPTLEIPKQQFEMPSQKVQLNTVK